MVQSSFWAKYDARTGASLSLLAHSLDVALVFRALCNVKGVRRSLTNCTAAPLTEEVIARLAVLAMLHDLGKANLGFQDKIKPGKRDRAGHIKELEPLFSEPDLQDKFLASLPRGVLQWFGDPASADNYFYAIFSHHGRPVEFLGSRAGNYRIARDVWWRPTKNRDPFAAIAAISLFAEEAFPEAFQKDGPPLPSESPFVHRFAGLVMLADWLGSHAYWFPLQETTPQDRLKHGEEVSFNLLRSIGFDSAGLRPFMSKMGESFQSRFNLAPRPLQETIDQLEPVDLNTRLLIAEAETGAGKTEAALNWFAKLFAAEKADSLYFALPTRVAARELYERINGIIKRWFPDPANRPVTLLAVPGYTQVDGQSVDKLLPDFKANIWEDERRERLKERHWAGAGPKRFLAATIAVGTIDQALLSAVQASHAHLRSVCLDRSLLVIDEVHASDIYMSFLLRSLLKHHLSVGSYAMLLSATLGSDSAATYVQITNPAFKAPSLSDAVLAPYPSLTLADGAVVETSFAAAGEKAVCFDVMPYVFAPEKVIGEVLIPALKAGARILVVLNTVARAVDFFKAVEKNPAVQENWLFSCGGLACPHHGRFAPEDRLKLDARVSRVLGKGSPAGPLALIGTQTLEQSLDIDADLLITDLAPGDVLLQRIGRLHRHRRQRPKPYGTARCVVLAPSEDFEAALDSKGGVSGEFARAGFGSVYEDLRSLQLTLQALEENPKISIPRENRLLVEKATHPELLQTFKGKRWRNHYLQVAGSEAARRVAAGAVTTPFGASFPEMEFIDAGVAVSTRLGNNLFQAPLNRETTSPFGSQLKEIFIPGHLAPTDFSEADVFRVEEKEGALILTYKDRSYMYSKYGLEVIT